MKNQAAKTGPGAMALVAIEQAFPKEKRIVSDDLAYKILPRVFMSYAWLMQRLRNWVVRKSEKRAPGLWASIMARKRYLDEQAVQAAIDGIEAVVNLGAGFDTRFYRLSAFKDVPTWEIDLVNNIAAKGSALVKALGRIPDNMKLVPIDFDNESLKEVLSLHGYNLDKKSLFVWEGVTQYLTEAGARSTFEFMSKSQIGSRLLFTYVPVDFIDGHMLFGQDLLYRQMVEEGQLWHFGINPDLIEKFLRDYGFRVLEHHGYDELTERYVTPTGRDLGYMEIERVVLAERVE